MHHHHHHLSELGVRCSDEYTFRSLVMLKIFVLQCRSPPFHKSRAVPLLFASSPASNAFTTHRHRSSSSILIRALQLPRLSQSESLHRFDFCCGCGNACGGLGRLLHQSRCRRCFDPDAGGGHCVRSLPRTHAPYPHMRLSCLPTQLSSAGSSLAAQDVE